MASSASTPADDLDPAEFVANIRKLGEKKDAEDAERLAKLEQEIELGRRERAIKRASRSLSPEKQFQQRSSRDSTPTPPRRSESPSPTTSAPVTKKMEDDSAESTPPTTPAPPTATQLARSGTLSWQQRPKSRGGEGRRPLSWLAQENAARSPKSTLERSRSPTKLSQDISGLAPEPPSPVKSRAQIAESLGSKDPTWFRQPSDGSRGSAAYRRSQVEDVEDVEPSASKESRMRLPGMSRETAITPAQISPTSPPPDSSRSNSPSQTNSLRDSTVSSNRYSSTTANTESGNSRGMKSPPASILDAPKLDPSPSDRRTPTEARPPSPTKGMGGFVESAMLKRADSVSKRWSAQPGAGLARSGSNAGVGLTRSGSTASNRNSYMGGYGGNVQTADHVSSTLSSSRDDSVEPGSRPTSSHSNLTIVRKVVGDRTQEKDDDGFVKPAMPSRAHSRSKSVASLRSVHDDQTGAEPTSLSKRWSPTKSSWLESALGKEDKPKATSQAPPTQPSWMAEINKAKQQRAASPTKEVSSPFEKDDRNSPFGREALKSVSSPSTVVERNFLTKAVSNASPTPKPNVLNKTVSSPSPAIERRETSAPVEKVSSPAPEPTKNKSPPPQTASKPVIMAEIVAEPSSAPKEKPDLQAKITSPPPPSSVVLARKNTFEKSAPASPASNAPGKFDFRAQLKSRLPPPDSAGSKEPEFKNALGNLKRAKTQNYVAPDTFKDNITRGKGGLNITGGIPERKRVDELKEQLNAQKAAIKQRKESGEMPVRPQKPAEEEQVPEGLTRRKTLGRADAPKPGDIPGVRLAREEMPEALAAFKGLVGKKSPPPIAEKRISSLEYLPGRPSIAEKKKLEATTEKPVEAPISRSPELSTAQAAAPQPFALPGMVKAGASNKLAERFNPTLAIMLAKGPPTSESGSKDSSPFLSRATTQDEVKPGPELEHMTKGRARGPQRRAKGKKAEVEPTTLVLEPDTEIKNEVKEEVKPLVVSKTPVSTPTRHARTPSTATSGVSEAYRHSRVPSAQLVRPQHVLKSSPASSATRPESVETRSKPATPSKSPSSSRSVPAQSGTEPKTVSTPARLPLREHPGNAVAPKPTKSPSSTKIRALPTPPTESPEKDTSKASVGALFERRFQTGPPAKKSVDLNDYMSNLEATPPASAQKPLAVKIETPKKEAIPKSVIGSLFQERFQRTPPSRAGNNSPTPAAEDSTAPMSIRDSTALFARQESPGPFSGGSGRRSPNKLPTRHDEEKSLRDAGLMPLPEASAQPFKPSNAGLGISAVPIAQPSKVEVIRGGNSPLSPPLSVRASSMNGFNGPKTPAQSPKPPVVAASPVPHTSEATRLFGDFFNETPTQAKDEIDTLSVLEASPLASGKISTIKKQIQEITHDGKMITVPSHQEHMLFDQSMYVCTHTFETAQGSTLTEVYLWAGSDVSPVTLEDAQLFSRRVARDSGGKLIVLQQGQETPNFLQALGGILITFKGSKSRSSIGVPPKFVLCGRQHLGHIVFDEVDFTLHSFCSGFPYLISANNRLYLWKGIGCHQEELSSARLITMDVSPMPDLTEVEEGKEPISFFTLFPPLPKYPKNSIPRSADHWRLRPRHEEYRARLFRVEQVKQKSMSLQVSSFLSNVIKRRPSWSSFGNSSQPATPTTGLDTPNTSKSFFAEPSPTSEQPRTLGANEGTTTKIQEIAPFRQSDLKADGVFVVDAYFEVYIIIGPLAQAQAQSFSAALSFAQDYGILAASMQDRPFVPVSTVVLEGAPRDMKFCFRQWDNEKGVGGTEALMAGSKGIKRAGSLRCVGLSAALASLKVEP